MNSQWMKVFMGFVEPPVIPVTGAWTGTEMKDPFSKMDACVCPRPKTSQIESSNPLGGGALATQLHVHVLQIEIGGSLIEAMWDVAFASLGALPIEPKERTLV
jgi:hypothetical protein